MFLTHAEQRILQEMPDLSFGEDQSDYVKKCMSWAREQGHSSVEVMSLAKAKWKSWEIERLIVEIEEGSQAALQRAVLMLLKDRYIV